MAEEKKDFVVKDRRFSSREEEKEEEKDVLQKHAPESGFEKAESPGPGPGVEDTQLPEINFATFVLSLHSSALVHLGIIENPATGEKNKSLGLAKQTIDILGVIEKKTRGNLDKDEENLLKNILHDLRLMYVREKG